jgi:hypothetical protein
MIVHAEPPRVLSLIPGRIRLHLSSDMGDSVQRLKDRLSRIEGVESVQANALTGNVLIRFDKRAMDADALLAKLNRVLVEPPNGKRLSSAVLPNTDRPGRAGYSPLRVVVRGILGHAVVDSLWFGAGFLGSAMGLPLSGLGPLHLLMDVVVWTMALSGEKGPERPQRGKHATQGNRPASQSICPA